MKYLIALTLTIPTMTMAKMAELKPGKWLVKMTVEQNGKKEDPMAKMREALAKMPPEQRKQMEAMMKSQMGSSSEKGTEVCYSQKTFEQGAMTKPNKDCESNITENSASSFKATFSCKDGSKGNSEYTIKSGTHVKGFTNVTNAKGDKTRVENDMTFVSGNCGHLKPIEGV